MHAVVDHILSMCRRVALRFFEEKLSERRREAASCCSAVGDVSPAGRGLLVGAVGQETFSVRSLSAAAASWPYKEALLTPIRTKLSRSRRKATAGRSVVGGQVIERCRIYSPLCWFRCDAGSLMDGGSSSANTSCGPPGGYAAEATVIARRKRAAATPPSERHPQAHSHGAAKLI